jgi:hypothetical protein
LISSQWLLRADELGQEMAKWWRAWMSELGWENWRCLNWLRFERCTQLERELHSNKVVLQTGS